MSTVWIVLAVAFGVVALVSYFAGVRKGAAWGQGAVVLFTILAVACVFARTFKVGTGPRRFDAFKGARLVGEGLKGQLKDGARVVILRQAMLPGEGMFGPGMPPPPGVGGPPGMPGMPDMAKMVKEQEQGWQKALSAGAGVSVTIVASVPVAGEMAMPGGPFPGTAADFSKALEAVMEKNPDIDCWISMIGLPRNMTSGEFELDKVSLYQKEKPPLAAADVNVYYDSAKLRQWIQEGKLACAVVMTALDKPIQKVITKANLNELPEKSPMPEGMGPMGPMGPAAPVAAPEETPAEAPTE